MWIVRSAKLLQEEIDRLLPARAQDEVSAPDAHDLTVLFDNLVTDNSLVACSRDLFFGGFYALSVLEAFKTVCSYIKRRTGSTLDGSTLMQTTFSPKSPLLFLNQVKTASQKDEQLGYMQIFAGAMTGIRNPRAHEANYDDEPIRALEMLVMANHLMTRARQSKKKK